MVSHDKHEKERTKETDNHGNLYMLKLLNCHKKQRQPFFCKCLQSESSSAYYEDAEFLKSALGKSIGQSFAESKVKEGNDEDKAPKVLLVM